MGVYCLYIYVYFCNYDNNVAVYMFFSNDIIVFPLYVPQKAVRE